MGHANLATLPSQSKQWVEIKDRGKKQGPELWRRVLGKSGSLPRRPAGLCGQQPSRHSQAMRPARLLRDEEHGGTGTNGQGHSLEAEGHVGVRLFHLLKSTPYSCGVADSTTLSQARHSSVPQFPHMCGRE